MLCHIIIIVLIKLLKHIKKLFNNNVKKSGLVKS
jgi:hypothetical protein